MDYEMYNKTKEGLNKLIETKEKEIAAAENEMWQVKKIIRSVDEASKKEMEEKPKELG